MKKSNLFLVVAAFVSVFLFAGCSKDETPPQVFGTKRFIVINEGGYSNATSTINAVTTYGEVTADLFANGNNGRRLGSVGQSMTLIDGKYFITVSNSGKIEVTDTASFSCIETIEHGFSPYFIVETEPGKAIVSDVTRDKAWILDTRSYAVTGSIPVGMSSQYMTIAAGKVFFSCSGWDPDTKKTFTSLRVADLSNLQNVRTLGITPSHGARMPFDAQGRLWILTPDGAVCLDPATESVVKHLKASDSGVSTAESFSPNIDLRDEQIFINAHKNAVHGIYRMSVNDTRFPENPIFELSSIKGLYNVVSTPKNTILVCDAIDYEQSGKVYEFNLAGVRLDTFDVGICPNFIYFPEK